jgi:D-lactate dehydrogenase (cytochrome)
MRENVLNLTAVLADENGTIIKTGSRARKSSAGYDVTRLLIGSEGTLAIITEATLKLHTIPKISYSLRISFPSVKEASNTAATTFTSGINIRRCELMDDEMVKIINKVHPTMKPWIESNTLLYEITGLTEEGTLEQVEMVKDIAIENNASSIDIATDVTANNKLWMMRKECLWTIMATYPDREPMITDVCVPLTRLAELMLYAKEAIEASKLPCPIIAHAGDGNLHVNIIKGNLTDEQWDTELSKAIRELFTEVVKLGGTISGEHGIGLVQKSYMDIAFPEVTLNLMRNIKKVFDPKGILNAGKIF